MEGWLQVPPDRNFIVGRTGWKVGISLSEISQPFLCLQWMLTSVMTADAICALQQHQRGGARTERQQTGHGDGGGFAYRATDYLW